MKYIYWKGRLYDFYTRWKTGVKGHLQAHVAVVISWPIVDADSHVTRAQQTLKRKVRELINGQSLKQTQNAKRYQL